VHLALAEPEEWTSRYQGKIADPCRRLVAAAASHMDDGIRKVVEALERTGQRRSTLIVFSSDNGGQEHWANYGDEIYGSPHPRCAVLGDNRPLRGWQTELYEGGIRVPAFANWPGPIDSGVRGAVVSMLDWLPTLSRLGGYRPPGNLGWEGQDVWPVLLGRAPAPERTLYWRGRRAWNGPADRVALRHGNWKLVGRVVAGRIVDSELYDIASDPHEKHDLARRSPGRLAELARLLEAQIALDDADALRSRS
jgi:arylsulfatase A-like enzyme